MNKEFSYMKIYQHFVDSILDGTLKPHELLPSEAEISSLFNVSRITAKRAYAELTKFNYVYRIKGMGSFVSVQKKTMPNKAGHVAFVVPFSQSLGQIFDMYQSMSNYLNDNLFMLSYYVTNYSSEKERSIILDLLSSDIDGIILYPMSNNENLDLMYYIHSKNIPFVVVDKYFDNIPLSYVYSDNYHGSFTATEHLVELGHTNIAYVCDRRISEASSVRDRYFGYLDAMFHHDIPFDFINILRFNYTPSLDTTNSVLKATNQDFGLFLDQNPKLTAILASNDYLAILIVRALLARGLKVPEDVSVVGFDNIESASLLEVPLTTVAQNNREIGANAARLLLAQINKTRIAQNRFSVKTDLILRESTEVCSKRDKV